MILHILRHNLHAMPNDFSFIEQAKIFAKSGDSVILIEEGIRSASHPVIANFPMTHCFLLTLDAQARGFDIQNKLISHIDYSGFVRLTCQHQKTITW